MLICAFALMGVSFAATWALSDTPVRNSIIARSPDFGSFVGDFSREARAAGIPEDLIKRAFSGLSPDPSVLEQLNDQPEFERTAQQYLERAVSPERIEQGKVELARRVELFDSLEKRFGVDRHVIAAIWGLESQYGDKPGDRSVIRSLATLASQGRRQRYGRRQLLAAFAILAAGDVTLDRMRGSWAGAMGHTQFIPTTYLARAVDFNGDGRRDIWDEVADALASTANLLDRAGWRTGEPALAEIRLPGKFDYASADIALMRPLAAWRAAGVVRADGREIATGGGEAAVFLPAGADGPAFLVYPNFHVIMRYNAAASYALAIAHLAGRLEGGAPVAAQWPADDQPLTRAEREELQRRLNQAGHDAGGVDGLIGPRTRAAIRGFQRQVGLRPDGFANGDLLARLRRQR